MLFLILRPNALRQLLPCFINYTPATQWTCLAVGRASPSGYGWWDLSAPPWASCPFPFNLLPLAMQTQRTLWTRSWDANGRRTRSNREMKMGPNFFIWVLTSGLPQWGAETVVPFPALVEEGPERGRMLCLATSLFLGKVVWAGSSAVALTRDAHFLWQPCLFAGLRIIAPDLLEVGT